MERKPLSPDTPQELGPLPGLEEVQALFADLEYSSGKNPESSSKNPNNQSMQEIIALFEVESSTQTPPSSKRTSFTAPETRQRSFGPIPNFLGKRSSDPALRKEQQIAADLIRDGSPFAPRYLEAHAFHQDSFRDPLRSAKPSIASSPSFSHSQESPSFQRKAFLFDFSKSRISVTMSRMSFGSFLASLLGLGLLFFGAGFLVAALFLAKKDPVGVEAGLLLPQEYTLPLPSSLEPPALERSGPNSLSHPAPFVAPVPVQTPVPSVPLSLPSLPPQETLAHPLSTPPLSSYPPVRESAPQPQQNTWNSPPIEAGSPPTVSAPPSEPIAAPLAPPPGQPSLGQIYASDMSAIEQAIRSLNQEVQHLPEALEEPPIKKPEASGSPLSPAPKKAGTRGKKRKGTHAVQIGTFSRLETATRGIRDLPNTVKQKHHPRVVRVAGKKGPLYAIQLGPFPNASAAKKAQDGLPSWMKRWGPAVVPIKATDITVAKNS